MKVTIGKEERLIIGLKGSDGEFIVEWNEWDEIIVRAELADNEGRKGVIYYERPPKSEGLITRDELEERRP